jgi:hypothetical protein
VVAASGFLPSYRGDSRAVFVVGSADHVTLHGLAFRLSRKARRCRSSTGLLNFDGRPTILRPASSAAGGRDRPMRLVIDVDSPMGRPSLASTAGVRL